MNWPIVIAFAMYLLSMLVLGLRFWSSGKSNDGYLLGNRSLGSWVTALSAEASDMSGWLLMALPGAVYLDGPSQSWIAIGLLVGTYLNWRLVALRLRVYTEQTSSLTLPTFLQRRFADPTGLLKGLSAAVILLFFTIYASSGMVSTGKLIESVFGIPYQMAVLLGGGVVIAYTFLGGYLAVCWTDLFQGLLMVIALVLIPIMGLRYIGGLQPITTAMLARDMHTGLIPPGPWPLLPIISSASWGLGYFGQPHILARFMSARSLPQLRRSRLIAIIWVTISLTGAIAAGLVGIGMFENLRSGQQEKVIIYMIQAVAAPWLQGILLAAIMAAIMSTIDSQLLVSASSLTEDIYKIFAGSGPGPRNRPGLGIISRIAVICISLIAMLLALPKDSLILRIVAYAWAGFGASFGPAVLFALFSRRTTWLAVSLGMAVGAASVVLWRWVGLGSYLYEIVPGFFANCLTVLVVDWFYPQHDQQVITRHDHVLALVKDH